MSEILFLAGTDPTGSPNKYYALALAHLQLRLQEYAAAKKTLEPLLAGGEEGLKESALSLMKVIENYERPAPPTEREADGNAGAEATSQTRANDQPAGRRSYQLVGRPTLNLPGAQVMRGVLTAIECAKGNWVLIVQTPEKLVRFTVSDKEKLEFYSQDSQFDGNIGCGAVNRPAFIYFKPSPAGQAAAGDAVAVEITK